MYNFSSIPPAGGTPSIFEMLRFKDSNILAELEKIYPNKSFTFCASGKNALELALVSHLNTDSIIPGYSCPDVVSAALNAKKKVFLADIDPETLKPIIINSDHLFIATNPYGLIDQVPAGVDFIDDACQAGLSTNAICIPGSRGFAGVLSFGRGKAYGGVGGGVLITSRKNKNILDTSSLKIKELIIGGLTNLFERSPNYLLPSKLPFLNLGTTEVKLKYEKGLISLSQFLYAKASIKLAEKRRIHANSLSNFYQNNLPKSVQYSDVYVGMNRFPIKVFDQNKRNLIYFQLKNLGLSKSYPLVLNEYQEFKNKLNYGSLEGCKIIANSILTLPLHLRVTSKHQKQIVETINKIL